MICGQTNNVKALKDKMAHQIIKKTY